MSTSEQPRDQYGRPLVLPPEGGKLVPYTRVSTLSKALSDTTGLTNWKLRMVAKGAAVRPDLLALAQAAAHNGDDRELDRVVRMLLDAAGSSSKANVGTALHQFAEAIDRGETPLVPPQYREVMRQYQQTTADLEMLGSEKFVVNDELRVGGSFDRVARLPEEMARALGWPPERSRILVADIKTGANEPRFPLPSSIQIACYARGTVYNHELVAPRVGALADFGVNTEVGLMIHLPVDGSGCRLHLLDLNAGWLAAQRAVWVRAANRDKSIIKPVAAKQPNKGTNKEESIA